MVWSDMEFQVLLLIVFLCLTSERCEGKVNHKPSTCGYPPSQWCRSLEIAVECGVQKQCLELNATQPNSAAPPVEVTLYYESLCPGCRAFITQQLYPTWTLLKDIMRVNLVPYGNAQEMQNAVICQHGEPECHANLIEACILHMASHEAFHVINCMEAASSVLPATQPCLQLFAPSVRWESISACVRGPLGHSLIHENAAKTRVLNPAHTHVPWVTFNGVYTNEWEDQAMSSLFHLVCSLYKGGKPPACTGALRKLDRSFC
ncbi:gamma-interferon-inducible lysosomal thiol reductase [Alosa sapidissima]|uniref:gamma-interferon-inducible lysosomal thiol reductase n=1 Tax=Alosa sapidissima TaxID=34773 RepID=UPI001C08378A|nr:gamma-interferon-inducible lysosomal thiol reductase [Alosa sapidissima]